MLICLVCMAGTYLNGTMCTVCAEGFYNPDLNQTTCMSCDTNKTTDREGASSVDECGMSEPFKHVNVNTVNLV